MCVPGEHQHHLGVSYQPSMWHHAVTCDRAHLYVIPNGGGRHLHIHGWDGQHRADVELSLPHTDYNPRTWNVWVGEGGLVHLLTGHPEYTVHTFKVGCTHMWQGNIAGHDN